MVNEIALICDKLGLDVWEIIDAAATKPTGSCRSYPGLRPRRTLCIPVDPQYLSWKMKALNFSARFIELAGEVNSHMPEFVVEKITRALNERKKPINGSTIVLLGMAYKADVSDVRESPALDIFHLLKERGAEVQFHDPFVRSITVNGKEMSSKAYVPALLKNADAVVITTPHSAFDPASILRHSALVIDTRNLTRGLKAPHLVRL